MVTKCLYAMLDVNIALMINDQKLKTSNFCLLSTVVGHGIWIGPVMKWSHTRTQLDCSGSEQLTIKNRKCLWKNISLLV